MNLPLKPCPSPGEQEKGERVQPRGRIPLFLVGGGTGGHIYPLLSLLPFLPDPSRTLLITGSRPVEEEILKGYPYPRLALPWKRVIPTFRGSLRLLWDFFRSLFLVGLAFLRHRPRQVITTGGYIALPAGIAAILTFRHLTLMEPNRLPGRTTRLLKGVAKEIVALDPSWVPRGKRVLAAIPVRSQFLALPSPVWRPPHKILIVGGSQGAELLNRVVPRAFQEGDPVEILHISGRDEGEGIRSRYPAGLPVEIIPYAPQIWEEFSRAQLVISRAGASSLGELLAARRPAILIPFPHAGAHQRENARFFKELGGGEVVEEGEGFRERLRQALFTLLKRENYERALACLEQHASLCNPKRIVQWLGLLS